MTGIAERLKQHNRGIGPAESRVKALDTFGLRYVYEDDFNVIVEGRFRLNLAASFWRALDGGSQGYLISALYREINGPSITEKPAVGRDSGAEPGRTASTTEPQAASALAESTAGPTSPGTIHGGSASLLPKVQP